MDPQTCKKLRRFEKHERARNRIEVHVIFKSSEQAGLDREDFEDFLEGYKEFMMKFNGVVGKEELLDDFTTTRNLLDGEPDVIQPAQRTLNYSFPCRDVTNSVRLLELLSELQRADMTEIQGQDTLMLLSEVPDLAYLHLLCYAYYHFWGDETPS